jgi:hypothetical protein
MNANDSIGHPVMPSFPAVWAIQLKAEPEGQWNSLARIMRLASNAINRYGMTAGMMNWFFCISLWLSLLFALWMSRGWMGLLFSGQVLSAGTCLVKRMVRKTQLAFSPDSGSTNRL